MRINISKLFVFGLAIVMLASLCVVSAQEPIQNINGQVRDDYNNDPISGAEVRFTSQADGTPYTGYTDGGGNFFINNIFKCFVLCLYLLKKLIKVII